jgi:hypothetical protein
LIESFHPGAEYGYPYQVMVWVCTNAVPRSFERCDLHQSAAVLETFRQKIGMFGLGQRAFVFNSGCMLGCKQEGTTVAILHIDPAQKQPPQAKFFRKITPADVEPLIRNEILAQLQTR